MNWKSVLKKVGEEVLHASEAVPVWGQFARIGASLIPGDKDDKAVEKVIAAATDKLDLLEREIVAVETFGQALALPGDQKAIAVGPAALQILLEMRLVKGKKPKDAEQSKADAAAVGGAIAKFLNGFE